MASEPVRTHRPYTIASTLVVETPTGSPYALLSGDRVQCQRVCTRPRRRGAHSAHPELTESCLSIRATMRCWARSSFCAAVVTATVSTSARRCQLTACKRSPTTTLRRQLTFAMAIRSIGQDSADNMGVTSWWPGRRSTTRCAATSCRRPRAAKLVPLRRQCSASATLARRHQLAVCRHAPQPRQQLSPLRRGGMYRCLCAQDRNRTHLGAPSPTAARSRRAVDLHTNHTKNVAMNSRSSRAQPCTSRRLEPRALRHIRFGCDGRRRGRGAK